MARGAGAQRPRFLWLKKCRLAPRWDAFCKDPLLVGFKANQTDCKCNFGGSPIFGPILEPPIQETAGVLVLTGLVNKEAWRILKLPRRSCLLGYFLRLLQNQIDVLQDCLTSPFGEAQKVLEGFFPFRKPPCPNCLTEKKPRGNSPLS